MPWRPMETVDLRREFVALAGSGPASMSELCRRYLISRKTGYKWLRRYREGGETGLRDRSRRPRTQVGRTEPDMEQLVVEMRREQPVWGARKIRRVLERRGAIGLPAMSTITRILRRNGLVGVDGPTPARPFRRFEHPVPNALWQMDFKGWFRTLAGPCHPLTILDDCSRFDLCLAALGNERTASVKTRLEPVFERYGVPDAILTDNGSPWGSDADHVHTPLTVWLTLLGIQVIHIRPYHPQTQGKEERFHRTLNQELISRRQWRDLDHCQEAFDAWRLVYNMERPHDALGGDVPADRYRPSLRPFPRGPLAPDYPEGATTRKVQDGGRISFRGHDHRVGKAFRGHYVRLIAAAQGGSFDVYFGHSQIARIETG